MDYVILGAGQPLVSCFVRCLLAAGHNRVVCLAEGSETAAALRARLDAGPLAATPEIRLAGTAAEALPPGGQTETWWFPTTAEVQTLLAAGADGATVLGRRLPIGWLAAVRRFRCVVDAAQWPFDLGLDEGLAALESALLPVFAPDAECRLYCLDTTVDTEPGSRPPQALPTQTLTDAAAGLLAAIRRRSPSYFDHYPLQLPDLPQQPLHLLPTATAAAFLASAGLGGPSRRHLLRGTQTMAAGDFLRQLAEAGGIPWRGTDAASPAPDAAGPAITAGLRQLMSRNLTGERELAAVRHGRLSIHEIAAPPVDLPALWRQAWSAQAAASHRLEQPFAALAVETVDGLGGTLQRKPVPGSAAHYLVVAPAGSRRPEARALLLVNAFGLALDFWQRLAGTLRDRHTLLAIDQPSSDDAASSLSLSYYSADDYVGSYLAEAIAALDAEGFARCDVISWCSGAKLAMELARRHPERVASLSFVTPSFAGVEGFAGSDSGYEKSLLTMCRIVRQTPQAAAQMASTMTAMLQKGSADFDRFRTGRKDAVNVLELADQAQLPLLYRPFASAANMVEFSRQLMHFREHDIQDWLTDPAAALPVLLVTGAADTTTSSARARDLCGRLDNVVGYELGDGSHYLLLQQHQVLAELLEAFLAEGTALRFAAPGVEETLRHSAADLVSGAL